LYTIYKHTLILDCAHKGWSYIGLTKQDLKRRWKNGTGYPKTTQPYFARAIEKYGWSNFSHEILETDINTLQEANEREKYWIAHYHSFIGDPNCRGYNCTAGGDGQEGHKHTEATKLKLHYSHLGKGHPWSDYQRQVMSSVHECRKVSEESRLRMSESHKGIEQTKQTKEKISKANSKKVICLETGEVFESFIAAGKSINKSQVAISNCVSGKLKTAGGFHWQIYNDSLEEIKKMKTVSFKVKDEVFAKMLVEADKNGLSVSAWIRVFILDALKKAESEDEKFIGKIVGNG
jgi:group I intron endonuclease